MIDIVDSHLHLWDIAAFLPPWLTEAPSLLRTFSLEDWRSEAETPSEWRLTRAVYIEVDAAPADRPRENRDILDLAGVPGCPVGGAVIAADLLGKDVADDLAPWLDKPGMKGVRHVLHTPSAPRGTCLQPRFIANVRRLGELGLVFDACLRRSELGDLLRLAEAASDTTIVLDHCGNPGERLLSAGPDHPDLAEWRAGIERLTTCENVVCKLSGLPLAASADPKAAAAGFDYCLDLFGPERVLWGSNFPVCRLGTSLRRWADFTMAVSRKRGLIYQHKLFSANAERIYRLGG